VSVGQLLNFDVVINLIIKPIINNLPIGSRSQKPLQSQKNSKKKTYVTNFLREKINRPILVQTPPPPHFHYFTSVLHPKYVVQASFMLPADLLLLDQMNTRLQSLPLLTRNRRADKTTLIFPTLSSYHPLFQGISIPSSSGFLGSKNFFLLKLSMMKCWNFAFNAQGSRVIYSSRGVSENICSSSRGRSAKRKEGDETQITNQNWWKN
jgi:hypothetical protein